VKKEKLSADAKAAALAHIQDRDRRGRSARSDLIIEAATENLELS